MRFRERSNDRERSVPTGSEDPAGGAGARERWQGANDLLARADAAIDRALSQDSDSFLDSNRQEGGQ